MSRKRQRAIEAFFPVAEPAATKRPKLLDDSPPKTKKQAPIQAYFSAVDPTGKGKGRAIGEGDDENEDEDNYDYDYDAEDDDDDEDEPLMLPKWVLQAGEGEPPKIRDFPPVKVTPLPPVLPDKPGSIRVLKIYTRFAKVPDESVRSYPRIPGYTCYNVCKNRSPYHTLSPMLLGPVHDERKQLYAYNIEDGWQCSKVWPFHAQQGPRRWRYWREWSRIGRFSRLAKRHRTPAVPGQQVNARNRNIPLYSVYMNDQMDYGTARKRMYCRWYEELAPKTTAWQDLRNRHLMGQNLILLDYDGLDRLNPEENVDLTHEKLLELINDTSRPFGHGLVLAATLMGHPVWRE